MKSHLVSQWLVGHDIELFIKWSEACEYYIILDCLVTVSLGSFFSISSWKEDFLAGENPFFLIGRE